METEEKNKSVKMKALDRLKKINDKYSTAKIIRGGVLKSFEFKTNNEVKKHEIKEEMLNPSEANNSMFGKDVLDEYGIKKEESGEYVMSNQTTEKENGEELEIG